ncbi:MAG: DegT/DnrJ/EryC1/StrS family aminotransferase [Thermoprotei archaeon]
MKRIKIADPYIDGLIENSVLSVLRGKNLVMGSAVEAFEKGLASYLKVKHVVAVSSGTAALHTAFVAAKLGRGKVLVPAFTFAASANTVLLAGYTPVFVDIDLETYNMNPEDAAEKLDQDCKAIEPVHLYGMPADMPSIQRIASANHLQIIEDCAQSLGAICMGKMTGTFGSMGCFSTYPTKNLHTGEGGFVSTDDDELDKTLRLLRNHGQESRYNHVELGFNYRMTELQAAIGIPQISKLEEFTQIRRRNAAILSEGLENLDGLYVPVERKGYRHVYHQYTIRVDPKHSPMKRDKLSKRLLESGIETSVHYPKPVYLQPYYRKTFGYRPGMCPNSEIAAETVLSLPVHPGVSEEDAYYIVKSIKSILSEQ